MQQIRNLTIGYPGVTVDYDGNELYNVQGVSGGVAILRKNVLLCLVTSI